MNRLFSLRACAAGVGSMAAMALPAALAVLPAGVASAQQAGYGQTLGTSTMERQLYDYGPSKSGSGSGSILDSTNPLDLLNKLKRSSALDDATSPSSAIDQALRDFDAKAPKPSSAGSAGKLQGI
jgi:hypothetical protein